MLNTKNRTVLLSILAVLALAFILRSAGLFRGLEAGYKYHPDEPKQVVALNSFLNGTYVWYVDSRFYDGYPYGLNHIDEWLLRPVFEVGDLLGQHTIPESRSALYNVGTLYWWARGLRVLYGLIVLLLAYAVSKRLLKSPAANLLVLLFLALAPLSVAVAHFATGDIGLDLFTAAMLLFLCFYARNSRKIHLFLAAVALGIAFGCKYNGLLAGAAIGVYLLLEMATRKQHLKQTILKAGTVVAGLLIGAIAVTPAFLFDWKRTWKDMRINLAFVKNYGVDEAFLSKPWYEKIILSFGRNFPVVIEAVGWTVLLAGLAGAVLAAIQLYRKTKSEQPGNRNLSIHILRFSIFVYPFLAFAVSFAAKPRTQPFHFSYLQIPLTLSAVYFLYWMWASSKPAARATALAFCLLILLELGIKTEREHFFWSRDDNLYLVHNMPKQIYSPAATAEAPGTIKSVSLEPDSNPSIFRNRQKAVSGNRFDFWNRLHIAPVPSIPYPVQYDWIFMNGPIFPRNDRMVRIKGDSSISRVLVFEDVPETISLGIRAGNRPTRVRIELGGNEKEETLLPNTQKIIAITPEDWREGGGIGNNDQSISFVSVRIDASVGTAVVNFMTAKREIEYYRIFGGGLITEETTPLPIADIESIADAVEETNYLKENYTKGLNRERTVRHFPRQRYAPLPAGIYNVELDVTGHDDQTELSFELIDPLQLNGADEGRVLRVEKGRQTIGITFSKTFAPYECRWRLEVLQGDCELNSFTMKPNTTAIWQDLKKNADTGELPAWLKQREKHHERGDAIGREIEFGGKLALKEFQAPKVVPGGQKLNIRCAMELEEFPFKHFDHYHLFLHFIDEEGQQVYATDCPLRLATASLNQNTSISFGNIPELSPGAYSLKLGVWNGRTRKRLSVKGEGIDKNELSEKRVTVGKLHIAE